MSAQTPQIRAALQQVLAHLQSGEFPKARGICERILSTQPQNFHALHLGGIAALQMQDYSMAEHWLARAAALDPSQAAAHSNLAAALLGLRQPLRAFEHAETALRLEPNLAPAWNNRGNALVALSKPSQADESFSRALRLGPLADAYLARARLRAGLGHTSLALEDLHALLRAHPGHSLGLNELGVLLMRDNRLEEALSAFDALVARAPNSADAWNNRGSALRRLRRVPEALESYERALMLEPHGAEILGNVANAWLSLERLEQALQWAERALDIDAGALEALNIRATVLRDLKRPDAAAASFQRLLQLAPEFDYALGNLLFAEASLLKFESRDTLTAPLITRVLAGARAALPFSFLSMSDDAAAQLRCARTFAEDRLEPLAREPRRARVGSGRLRLAYVSADFGEHAVSYLTAGFLERHDRARFETYGVSLRPLQDTSMARRMRNAFEHFVDLSSLTSAAAERQLDDAGLDIAVDLSGYTSGMRPELFVRRIAPVQVNYLGYPGTLGASYMDYVLADDYVIPPEQRRHYREHVAFLPVCFQSFDDRRHCGLKLSRAELGLPEDAFVFCCFNNSYKINSAMFAAWSRVLAQRPESVLWLLGEGEEGPARLRQAARRHGITGERLIFAARCGYEEYLARLRLADLFLDTLPFNAGATASDALAMGLPLLTVSGEAFASRMAGSLLRALGLQSLITENLSAYETRALHLAEHPEELAAIRAQLTRARTESPLFDSARFCQAVEQLYEGMWARVQAGEGPADLAASAFRTQAIEAPRYPSQAGLTAFARAPAENPSPDIR